MHEPKNLITGSEAAPTVGVVRQVVQVIRASQGIMFRRLSSYYVVEAWADKSSEV